MKRGRSTTIRSPRHRSRIERASYRSSDHSVLVSCIQSANRCKKLLARSWLQRCVLFCIWRNVEKRIVLYIYGTYVSTEISSSLKGDTISSLVRNHDTSQNRWLITRKDSTPFSLLSKAIRPSRWSQKHLPCHLMTQNRHEFAKHGGLLTRLPIRTRRFLGLSVLLLTRSV